jgi:hypothetical protein
VGRHKRTGTVLSGYDGTDEAESSGKDDDDTEGDGEELVYCKKQL